MSFPIDLKQFTPQRFPLSQTTLSDGERLTLQNNIRVVRDSLIFFTAYANVKGLGGHTGGAFDIVPELLIIDAFMKATRRSTRSISTRPGTGWRSST